MAQGAWRPGGRRAARALLHNTPFAHAVLRPLGARNRHLIQWRPRHTIWRRRTLSPARRAASMRQGTGSCKTCKSSAAFRVLAQVSWRTETDNDSYLPGPGPAPSMRKRS